MPCIELRRSAGAGASARPDASCWLPALAGLLERARGAARADAGADRLAARRPACRGAADGGSRAAAAPAALPPPRTAAQLDRRAPAGRRAPGRRQPASAPTPDRCPSRCSRSRCSRSSSTATAACAASSCCASRARPRTRSRSRPSAVHRAAPFGDVSRLPRPWKFVETFLFDDDRRFKPRTLDSRAGRAAASPGPQSATRRVRHNRRDVLQPADAADLGPHRLDPAGRRRLLPGIAAGHAEPHRHRALHPRRADRLGRRLPGAAAQHDLVVRRLSRSGGRQVPGLRGAAGARAPASVCMPSSRSSSSAARSRSRRCASGWRRSAPRAASRCTCSAR